MSFDQLAAYAATAAAVTLVISGITIALFFGGAGTFWGPINDVFIAITMLLLVVPILAVMQLRPDGIGPWFGVVSVAAVLGALLVAIGQLLLVAGGISLQTSYVTGGIGVVPVLIWLIALAYLVFTQEMMSAVVGYLVVGVLVATALVTIASVTLPWPVTALFGVAQLLLLVGWLAALSAELRVIN